MLLAQPNIEAWFRSQWMEHAPPFYGSVDLRNSGYKLAPVDMNLFPGGFNNLNPDFTPLCVQAVQSAIEKVCPDARRLLLIPENHTRNQFYLQNVAALARILRLTGLTVRLGSLNPEITAPTPVELPNGTSLLLEPLQKRGRRLLLDDFDPCIVLLNNDLSAGLPDILRDIDQALLPPLHAGWAVRRKTTHFAHYDEVANEFAALIGIDPWYINPYFARGQRTRLSVACGRRAAGGRSRPHSRQNCSQIPRAGHRRYAVRHRQGRCGHLWHGRDDGPIGRGNDRPQSQAA